MKKKLFAAVLSLTLTAAMLAGCKSTGTGSTVTGGNETASNTAKSDTTDQVDTQEAKASGSFRIGISQFAEHGSLENCKEGFIEGLAQEGIREGENLEILFENAQADTGTASTIADSFVSKKVDLICAIATPSAMSAYNSCLNTDIPVVYTAVSDPVGAGLASGDGASVGNITGTADQLPVKEQLEMIRAMMPEAEKIGILYTTSEANSVSTIETYKELAGDYGFEIVDTGINTISDVEMAAKDMAAKVDCITNLTDNTVVSALQTVLAAANDKKIPVFGSEIEQVKNGCLAAMGIDYIALGKQTGVMAAKVLKGEAKAEELSYETCQGASLYVNTAQAAQLGFELDDSYVSGAEQVFDEIVVE